MRNNLYLWVVALCLRVASPVPLCLAQTSDAFRNQMNTIFQNVNSTPISTGLLWDYGLELTDATQYNGTITSSNYVNMAEWRMLYSSLYTMRFNNNISMTAPGTVNSQIRSNGMLSTAEIYNQDQELMAKAYSEDGRVVLDTHLYAKGTYFLHIFYEGEVQQKQILIE
jgi:hypothetical protein